MSENKEQGSLKTLKTIVIAMGIVLIVGTIFLFVAIYHRAYNNISGKSSNNPDNLSTASITKTKKCEYQKEGQINIGEEIEQIIPKKGKLFILTKPGTKQKPVSAIHDGNSLTLSTNKEISKSQNLIIYNLCTGEVISKIKLLSNR